MSNGIILDIILTLISLFIIFMNILYKEFQIRKINKVTEYNEIKYKNYEYILNQLLMRKK